MGKLSQLPGKILDSSKLRRKSTKDPAKSDKKIVSKDNSKDPKPNPNEAHSSSPDNPSNEKKSNCTTDYTGTTKNLNKEKPLRQRKHEEDNKYVDQALDIIQFTVQEAVDLEQLIKMSEKLSSDTKYVREVMSRLLAQLNKIETVNNKKITQKKNEGIFFIKEKIKQLVNYSKEIKRIIINTKGNEEEEIHLKTVASKCINTEQVEERKKQRQETNKYLKLTTINEDLEKEEISDEESLKTKPIEVKKFKTNEEEEELFHPCDEEEKCITNLENSSSLNLQKIQKSLSSSFVFPPNTQIKSSSSSILDLNQKSQETIPFPFVLNTDHSSSNIHLERTFLSSSFVFDPNSNVHLLQKSSHLGLDSNQSSNIKFRRVVGPYIIINQDVRKSTVKTIQDKSSKRVTLEDEVSITETRSVQLKSQNSSFGSNILFLPDVALEIRLLVILFLSILVEIPILMLICPMWS